MSLPIQPNEFIWAVGIENTFIPQAKEGMRPLEEFQLTQHYELWRQDLDRVASLGVTHLRWGPPWYRVEPKQGHFDWAWTDQVLDYMVNQKRLTPILDLMHYGTPLWLARSFDDPQYPTYVADYAAAFAERYGELVKLYTPLNEPLVNAEFCGQRGEWPPYLTGNRGLARLIVQLVAGQQETMSRLRQIVPDCTLVAVEAMLWHYGADELQETIADLLDFRLISYHLVTGQLREQQPAYGFLVENGISETQISDLLQRAEQFDWLGVNFYPWSGGEVVRADGELQVRPNTLTGEHLASVLEMVAGVSDLPLLVTETSARRSIDGRAQWMDETIAATLQCRAAGLPVIGYTWFPVITMIDWAYRLDQRPLADHLLHLGLWDSAFDAQGMLQRHPTPLVDRYRGYVQSKP